jgi:hypothetical protein
LRHQFWKDVVQVTITEFTSLIAYFKSFHFLAILHQPKLGVMIVAFDWKKNTIERHFVFMGVEMPSLHWETHTAVMSRANDLLSVTTANYHLPCANDCPLLCPDYCKITVLFLCIPYDFLIVSKICSLLETKFFECFQTSLCIKNASMNIMHTDNMFG